MYYSLLIDNTARPMGTVYHGHSQFHYTRQCSIYGKKICVSSTTKYSLHTRVAVALLCSLACLRYVVVDQFVGPVTETSRLIAHALLIVQEINDLHASFVQSMTRAREYRQGDDVYSARYDAHQQVTQWADR